VLGIAGRPGAFAERLALPARNLLPVPEGVPDRHAVFCEPLAAALAIGEQVTLAPGLRALVAGDGRLGLLCAQVLRLAGLEVELAGRHPERASWLPDGITPRAHWLEEAGAPVEARATFDLAVEATGDPDVLARVLPLVRPRGTVVLKTTAARPAALDLAPLVVDELTLVGSRCGRFGPALDLLASGRVIVEPMLHDRYPLEQGPAAFARAGRPGTLKVLVDIGPE
jgi:threonine dehydrogenase-like Zn-dependent dehydrogenase